MIAGGSTVYAAAAGVLVPFPDKAEDRSKHMRPVRPENMTFPGTLSNSAVIATQVHQLFPSDGAIFPPNAAITLSWRMPDQVAMPDTLRIVPKYFRVEVISHTQPVTVSQLYFPYHAKESTYNGVFTASRSGRYGWQVHAIMDNGAIIKSPARYFIVKQPYYYNHGLDMIPEIYPHYYYDSQDHRR